MVLSKKREIAMGHQNYICQIIVFNRSNTPSSPIGRCFATRTSKNIFDCVIIARKVYLLCSTTRNLRKDIVEKGPRQRGLCCQL